ncbi:TetR/AcrR family transcriptional regulator [Pseudodesulfovibrio senegalensis]|jgi:AcrR family transcriptional regulator|uniref:TetR/AcrR family transcriptional regulator n=1 Tax=Pseudodesulfovibrio senegalensis TaxID=1721087 RepID=A0A6N6N0T4_9BACT|nr:TetR/AcrR family transcriptional regulator [Pseudodesulfovibrio senegalensis]KAB1441343.1 TetR/AcrR family transcriptional regulator [Pseudodesulfovibrio senegalensis]
MKKKEAILKVATVLFANKGYSDTSVQELSRLTGAAEGTIFYHFGTKEGLLLAILEQTRKSIVHQFEEFLEAREFSSGLDRVEETVSFYLYLAGFLEDQFLLLHRHHVYQFSETNPEFRKHLEEIYNCLTDFFEWAIIAGQEDGTINPELHPRKTALILFTMVDGLVRFKNYNLYDAGALFNELMNACRTLLQATQRNN